MSFYLYQPQQKIESQSHNQKYFSRYQRIYASGETLANVSYKFDNIPDSEISNKTYQILNEQGEWCDYQVYPIKVPQDGLKSFVLIPLDPNNKEVKLVFRGTADLPSLWRDLEIGSPGTQSFDKNKDTIYNSLLDIVRTRYSDPTQISLTVAGHSLGSSDAENFATFICDKIANADTTFFSALNVFSLNSPGITHDATKSSIESVKKIKSLNPAFKISVHYGKTEHDIIQQLGQNHFLNGIDPSLAEVDLIELKKKYIHSSQITLQDINDIDSAKQFAFKLIKQYLARTIDAHKLNSYFTPDQNGFLTDSTHRYKILSNQNPNQLKELESELDDKANKLLFLHQYLKIIFDYLGSYFKNVKILRSELSNDSNAAKKSDHAIKQSELPMITFDRHNQSAYPSIKVNNNPKSQDTIAAMELSNTKKLRI